MPEQIITIPEVSTTPGSTFTVEVFYETQDPVDNTLSELSFYVHYDSSKLTLENPTDPTLQLGGDPSRLPGFGNGGAQIVDNVPDNDIPDITEIGDDGDSNTDLAIQTTWTPGGQNFPDQDTDPAAGGVLLYTAEFTATQEFDQEGAILNVTPVADVDPQTDGIQTAFNPDDFATYTLQSDGGVIALEGGDDDITVNLSIEPAEGSEDEPTTFTLTATASAAVSGEQTVDLALSGDADADDFTGDLPGTIAIADGDTTGTVDVTVNDDDVEEGEETATFTISNPSGGVALGDTVEASATIADNDDAVEPTEPTVELSINPEQGSEAEQTLFTFTATASEAVTEEQTVDLALSGDADADDFVGDLPAAITIADGQTTGTVEVTVNDDDVEEGEETATFTISNPSSGLALGANTSVDFAIEDNDADTPAEELQGDFNDDGITNLNDLGLFAVAFGSSEGDDNFNSIFDISGDDGLINNDDLSQLGNIFADEFVAA